MPILALGVVIAILYLGRLFFITSLIALTIAFILEPFVALLMRFAFRARWPVSWCARSRLRCCTSSGWAHTRNWRVYTTSCRSTGSESATLVDGVQQKIAAMEDQTYKVVVPARQRQEEERRRQQEQAAASGQEGQAGRPGSGAAAGRRRGRFRRSGFTRRARRSATTSIRA